MMTIISRNKAAAGASVAARAQAAAGAAGAAAQVAVIATRLKAMPTSTMTLLTAKTTARCPQKGLGNVYARARERRHEKQ